MRIGRLFGIDLEIHVGWLFIFALVAWSFASEAGPLAAIAIAPGTRALIAVGGALALFASVVAHEFTHALVSRGFGMRVSKITLYLFGGVAQLEGEMPTPLAEALVAGAGPLCSLAIGAALTAIASAIGRETALGAMTGYLGYANVVLAAFNVLPALPLDGGRLFHAIAWRVTGSTVSATETAARVGRFIAGGVMLAGIAMTIYGGLGGLWLVLIGWFIFQAGEAERTSVEAVDALRGVRAVDIAAVPSDPIPADATARTALDRLIKSGRNVAPVMLDEQLLGIVSLTDLFRTGSADPGTVPVTSVMTRVADVTSLSPDAPAADVLRLLGQSGFRQIPLIDANGRLVGFVTREGVVARLAADR